MSALDYPGEELGLFAAAKNWKRYFSDLLRPYVRGNVLEVGAGIGATMEAMWNPAVSTWLCLEPDPALSRDLATRIAGLAHANVRARTATLDDLTSDERFDCILYIDVLEHIREDREELQRAALHLSDSGCIVVLSPAFQLLFSEFDRALGHERRYTARTLAAVFPPDLTRVRLFYADSVGAFLSLSNRVMLRKELPSRRQILFWDRGVIPLSRALDRLTKRWFGRSVIAVYCRRARPVIPSPG